MRANLGGPSALGYTMRHTQAGRAQQQRAQHTEGQAQHRQGREGRHRQVNLGGPPLAQPTQPTQPAHSGQGTGERQSTEGRLSTSTAQVNLGGPSVSPSEATQPTQRSTRPTSVDKRTRGAQGAHSAQAGSRRAGCSASSGIEPRWRTQRSAQGSPSDRTSVAFLVATAAASTALHLATSVRPSRIIAAGMRGAAQGTSVRSRCCWPLTPAPRSDAANGVTCC